MGLEGETGLKNLQKTIAQAMVSCSPENHLSLSGVVTAQSLQQGLPAAPPGDMRRKAQMGTGVSKA